MELKEGSVTCIWFASLFLLKKNEKEEIPSPRFPTSMGEKKYHRRPAPFGHLLRSLRFGPLALGARRASGSWAP